MKCDMFEVDTRKMKLKLKTKKNKKICCNLACPNYSKFASLLGICCQKKGYRSVKRCFCPSYPHYSDCPLAPSPKVRSSIKKIEKLDKFVHFGIGGVTFDDLHNDLVPIKNKIDELIETVNTLVEEGKN